MVEDSYTPGGSNDDVPAQSMTKPEPPSGVAASLPGGSVASVGSDSEAASVFPGERQRFQDLDCSAHEGIGSLPSKQKGELEDVAAHHGMHRPVSVQNTDEAQDGPTAEMLGSNGWDSDRNNAAWWLWHQHCTAMAAMAQGCGLGRAGAAFHSGGNNEIGGQLWGESAGASQWAACDDSRAAWSYWPGYVPDAVHAQLRDAGAVAALPQMGMFAGNEGIATADASLGGALDMASVDRSGQWPEFENDKTALELLKRMKADTAAGHGEALIGDGGQDRASMATAATKEFAEVPSNEGATVEDIASAVQQFLAGEDVECASSDNEQAEEGTASATNLNSISDSPVAVPDAEATSRHDNTISEAATSLHPESCMFGSHQPNFPSPEDAQDFLDVLRRRALPAEISDERLPQVQQMLLQCVMGLYQDRIKPVQHVLRKRLQETCPFEIAAKALLPLCSREPTLYRILPPFLGEQPVVLLVEEPMWFAGWVDVEGPDDNYSDDVWKSLEQYLCEHAVRFHAQPHQAACELRDLNLPFLQQLSLAEIEHVVRLCIGHRTLLVLVEDQQGLCLVTTRKLGESDGNAGKAPANTGTDSDTGVAKDGLASTTPNSTKHASDTIVDRDDLAVVLLQLMQRYPEGVSLSLLKQSVQIHCGRNLNEATFGCTKLVEVFKLQPLQQIFLLEHVQSRNEIIVRPPRTSQIPQHIWQKFYLCR